jgi:hypothetical protein
MTARHCQWHVCLLYKLNAQIDSCALLKRETKRREKEEEEKREEEKEGKKKERMRRDRVREIIEFYYRK